MGFNFFLSLFCWWYFWGKKLFPDHSTVNNPAGQIKKNNRTLFFFLFSEISGSFGISQIYLLLNFNNVNMGSQKLCFGLLYRIDEESNREIKFLQTCFFFFFFFFFLASVRGWFTFLLFFPTFCVLEFSPPQLRFDT